MAGKDRLSPTQATLYRSIARVPSGVLEQQLTGHELRIARSLADRGLLRLGDRITAIPPWSAPAKFRAAIGEKIAAKKLVDFSKRDPDEWKRPRTSRSKDPVFCVSVPNQVHSTLRDAGPANVRALLAEVARIGHERSLEALPSPAHVERGSIRRVYGVAVPELTAAKVKGRHATRRTGIVLRAAAIAGIEQAIKALEAIS